ncbi:MAG: helix-turn-helix transcriptional regulator [Oscillospiraceae bacterium]|nr:helix-turn-helix transcriptional regulator [Oscillospiraceae bacterium]
MKTEFSKRLAQLRKEKGLSQREASAELGISQVLLSHYENGAREPKFELLLTICDFYRVTADYLLGRTRERKNGAGVLGVKVREIMTSIEELKEAENGLLGKIKKLVDDVPEDVKSTEGVENQVAIRKPRKKRQTK